MRSEDGAGGLGAAVSARGPSWREKLAAAEVQFRRESPRRESAVPPTSSFSEGGAGKPREEKRTALSKVVLRRLPPGLTKEQLEEQLRPLPAHDYFEVVAADLSLYPHLYSRAYINFRNPDDILLFRDRFDGYIFIGNKGLEYPAVVEFAPFQKIAKKKLKKKDARTGSIEDDPEYKQFLETYSLEEEKTSASPETLLGEIEAKTRELLARRTTPLLEYIKNRKLEKQRIREEKREERRRRELEKKRLREEDKRKRREEERCKRKEAERQKKTEKEVRIKHHISQTFLRTYNSSIEEAEAGDSTVQASLSYIARTSLTKPKEAHAKQREEENELLKKLEKGEEPTTEKTKERGEEVGIGDEKQETCAALKARPLESLLETPGEK